jgi:hypothetical protein
MMTKRRTILGFTLVLALASTAAAQDWFKGSLDEAVARAGREGKKVLIDFFSYG